MSQSEVRLSPVSVGKEKDIRSELRLMVRWWPLVVVSIALVTAAFPWLFAPYNPDTNNLAARLEGPGFTYGAQHFLLGTDSLGRDVLSRVIWGVRPSVLVAIAAVFFAGVSGTILGVVSGTLGQRIGSLIMRVADMVLSIPFFLLAILVVAALGPSLINVVIVLALARWPIYARIAYGQSLEVSQRESVMAAIALGAGKWRIIRRHVLPEVLASLIVVATLEVGAMIVYEAALSFIGLGTQPPAPSWGSMLSEGEQYVATAWWISTFPGLALFILTLSINRLGDLIRDVLDPKK